MNIKKQISNRQTEPTSFPALPMSARPPSLSRMFMSFDRGRNVTKKMIRLGLVVLLWQAGDPGYAIAAQSTEMLSGEDRPSHHVITGTLDLLDFNTGKGSLKTDLGKPIFFDMVQPELFRRLSVGQRVTIGMNEHGQAVKVIEIPPVELPVPPSTVQ